ncbi:N-acetyl-gamma-glutamyl-phosphate reductase [bacterium]|nr:N-acetyl-gamma-glutamyl-phosphate reductase [bacterium]
MIKIGIAGATGYAGIELIRILLGHSEVKITKLAAKMDGKPQKISNIFPSLTSRIGLVCTDLDISDMAKESDLIFLALPHNVSLKFVPQFIKLGKKVIDLSADFRFDDLKTYEEWYAPHTEESKKLNSQAVYGLPELCKEKIKKANLIANPGCYPTSVILGVVPLLVNKLVETENIIADSLSGASGVGRVPSMVAHYPECNENVKAYSIATHRHTPEMEQELSKLAKKEIKISFTPHLLPMNRGILSTIYLNLVKKTEEEEIIKLYQNFYKNEPFVRILEKSIFPETRNVRNSNYCDIGIKVDERTNRIIIISAIDNLVKGASGQAVQNMNIMYGFKETLGLESPGITP